MTTTENLALIDTLDRHRGFLLQTADALTDDQARARSTVSRLTIASILKHVADTERQWMQFAAVGAEAFTQVYNDDTDWEAADAEATSDPEAWASAEDPRFVLTDEDTLEALRAHVATVAGETKQFLLTADLGAEHALPDAPWFEPGSWSVRRVALQMIAEIAQHSGHADIIREAIDGQQTMG
ncbi:DinB family protein [Mariniluteicoccus flavus]